MRPRRAILCFGALLMSPPLASVALSKPQDLKPGEFIAGQLLVATPEMGDPRFSRTVILMVQHNVKGAMGIVINRPIEDVPVSKLLDALGLDSKGSDGTVTLFYGGPVEPQIGFVVHSTEYRRAGTIAIDDSVAMSSDPAVLRDIGRHEGPRQNLIALGYAGWGPGQLEGEIAAGAWFTMPSNPQLVFEVERGRLWDEATKRRVIPL